MLPVAEPFYGPEELSRDLARLAACAPLIDVEVIGRSVLGKPICSIRVGEGPFRWHFNGACHANEWITSPLLVRFAEDLVHAAMCGETVGGISAADLLARSTVWIVPMLNPDGVELVQQGLTPGHPFYRDLLEWNGGLTDFRNWKANVRGVDLNDQFPAGWEEERIRRGTAGPSPRDFGGLAPLTEPEARMLAEWTLCMDFHAVLALHTQGEELYWNYRGYEPRGAEDWADRLARAAGYRAVRLEGSDAGYKDWFIQSFHRPGFTVEAGKGTNPLSLRDFPDIYPRLSRLLAEALGLPDGFH